ncbi:MAG: ComEC/Rec2 family competence protein, partial [Mogibacterium sp.]|nr:ComEC/Rec2 family competence protein [Mogibacterium sp.]
MIRRKLFAYTILFAAGISVGFFIFEKARIACGSLLLITLAVIICLADNSRNAIRLLAFLMAGFVVFTLRFIWYGTGMIPESTLGAGGDLQINDSQMGSIEGFARSVTVKDGKMKIVLCDTDCLRHGMRVMVTMRLHESDPDETAESEKSADSTVPYDDPYNPENFIGRRITAYGTLREQSGADNPGCFDYRVYLRSRGIGYQFSTRSVFVTQTQVDDSDEYAEVDENYEYTTVRQHVYGEYIRTLYFARERFLNMFESDECRAFIKGAVFGDKSDISEDVLEDFNGNGTGHILAVSGLHTGFLYALMRVLTRRRRNVFTAVLIIAVLILYGDMTMWSPSTMRAVTVLGVNIMAIYVKRPFDLLSAVSAAAMLILLREPYQLFSTGFQMSFLALLGIAFLAKPLSHFVGEAFAVMIAVQAGIIPVTVYCFHRINVLSVFINLPVIFIASILVPLCMSALFISSIAGLTGLSAVVQLLDCLSGLIVRLSEALT